MEATPVVFEVEDAGCSSCAALVREALAPLATVEAVDVDEDANSATVRMAAAGDLYEGAVNAALADASQGVGHAYRVKPGSWRPAA